MTEKKISKNKLIALLKKDYPEYLSQKETLNRDNLKILIPYALESKKLYVRKDIVQTIIALHEKISGKMITDTHSKVAQTLKDFLTDETKFSKSENIFGGWTYLGPSALKGESLVNLKTLKKAFQKPNRLLKYKVLKEVEAKESGDESMYVWWHPETEELAALKKEKTWAMKIGMHTSRNADKRIDEYKTSIPYKPIIGLIVYCKKSRILERTVHNNLTNRKRKIGEVGNEWYLTNVTEIEAILRFNELIE